MSRRLDAGKGAGTMGASRIDDSVAVVETSSTSEVDA